VLVEIAGGGKAGTNVVAFTTTWIQGDPVVEVGLGKGSIVTDVLALRQAPISKDTAARIKVEGSELPLGAAMTIVPYDGPCD